MVILLQPWKIRDYFGKICLGRGKKNKPTNAIGLSSLLKSNISLSEQFVVCREKPIRLQLEAAVNEESKYLVVLMLFDRRPRMPFC